MRCLYIARVLGISDCMFSVQYLRIRCDGDGVVASRQHEGVAVDFRNLIPQHIPRMKVFSQQRQRQTLVM